MGAFGTWIYDAMANEFLDEPMEWIVLAIAVGVLVAALSGERESGVVAAAVPPRNRLGKASLVLAVLAFLTSWSGVGGWLLGLLAQIVGFVARSARAGIVLGFVAVVIGLVFNAIWQDFSKAPL